MQYFNNPFNFLSKIKPDFDNFGIELRMIRYDNIFGGSWVIKFELDNENYQITWDSRENWLQFDKITKKDNYQEILFIRRDKWARTKKAKQAEEKFVIKNVLAALNKLKPKS